MQQIFLVALGGALGSVARYLVSTQSYRILGSHFPYGTLVVNAIGSFLIGLAFTLILERFMESSQVLRSLLAIGFLGGFTTFSAFSFETMQLLEAGKLSVALMNIFVSLGLCLILTWVGIILGRHL